MSNESAKKLMTGHGRVLCRKCEKVIITCKCMKCTENIQYDICDECEKKFEERGYSATQCRHGTEMYPEDGRDVMCMGCELGE